MLIIAEANFASIFSKTGDPSPAGTPIERTSITPPTESPSFLTLSINSVILSYWDLSEILNRFFSMYFSLKLLHFILPICATKPMVLILNELSTFLAIAPAATLATVSLFEDLPPPL